MAKIISMKTIEELLSRNGIDQTNPDYELFIELFETISILKESVEPFISNDPIKHRINIKLKGKVIPFMACQDDEYYLRMAAKIIDTAHII